jgi:competence protein ComEC
MATRMMFEFLDVGMGDGTLVIMGSGANTELALIDFGVQPFTKFKIGAKDTMEYLKTIIAQVSKDRGKTNPYLDHIFITHPDADHYNRILELVNSTTYPGYAGKDLDVGKLTFGGTRGMYQKGFIADIEVNCLNGVDDLTDKQRSPIKTDKSVKPFVTFVGGKIKVYLLSSNYPTKSTKVPNPLSLCLMFEDDSSNKVIFLGDAEATVEADIINYYKDAKAGFLQSYGLKLGHHGSVAGTSVDWVKTVKPKAIFASGDFVWAHPYCETIQRVLDNTTLGTYSEKLRFCCGIPGKEYFNNYSDKQVFINLWYVVKDFPSIKMEKTWSKKIEDCQQGLTWGVQWEMEFNGTGAPSFGLTETANPV